MCRDYIIFLTYAVFYNVGPTRFTVSYSVVAFNINDVLYNLLECITRLTLQFIIFMYLNYELQSSKLHE